MWIDATLKCPNEGEWLAVVRVTADGETTPVSYLSAIPDNVERELDAVQQRWIDRQTWPDDQRIQREARIEGYSSQW